MSDLGAKIAATLAASMALFAACTSEVVGLTPGALDGGARDGGTLALADGGASVDSGSPTSVFDPSAALEPPAVDTIFEPTGARPVMQGGDFRLVFTGSTYLLFWIENRGGGLHAVVQRVGPTTGDKRDLLPDPPPALDDTMDFPPQAVVEGDRVALAWATRRAVVMGWTDREGRLVEGPTAVRPVAGLNSHYLGRMHADPAGGYLFFGTRYDDRDDALRVTRVDPRGGLRDLLAVRAVFASADFDLGDVAPADRGGWRVSWHTRRPGPGSPNEVFTTALDRDLRVSGQRVHLTAEDAWSGELWPAGAPRFMAARVYGQGFRLLALDGSVERAVPANLWSQVVPERGGARVGLLVQTGSKTSPPSEGLPTGLSYQAWDPATDTLSAPTVLQRDDGRCLERAEGVAAGDRVGVAWVMGCSERVLYFVELRVR